MHLENPHRSHREHWWSLMISNLLPNIKNVSLEANITIFSSECDTSLGNSTYEVYPGIRCDPAFISHPKIYKLSYQCFNAPKWTPTKIGEEISIGGLRLVPVGSAGTAVTFRGDGTKRAWTGLILATSRHWILLRMLLSFLYLNWVDGLCTPEWEWYNVRVSVSVVPGRSVNRFRPVCKDIRIRGIRRAIVFPGYWTLWHNRLN